jgi:UDP:flavonoid glycosyltransferase YjiC (YdhE family)
MFGFSPHVVPPPDDWGDDAYVTGYWFLDEHPDWQPPADLARFLGDGEPPIYVGFGSMPSADPQATHDLILAALRQAGLRAVIGGGWGGVKPTSAPDFAYFVDHAPHEWLFERVAGVVHHGGAGTTAAGLRAGKPTMIIPHLGDQPYWGRRVHELGVGVKPIPRQKLTVEKLAIGIRSLVTDATLQANAARLGEQIRAERGVENAVRLIEEIAAKQVQRAYSSLSSGALKS